MSILQNALISLRRAMSFYAVARGRKIGVYDSWKECEEQTKGFKGARFKKFLTHNEALQFIKKETGDYSKNHHSVTYLPVDCAVPLGKANSKQNSKERIKPEPEIYDLEKKSSDCLPNNDQKFEENTLSDDELLATVVSAEAASSTRGNNKQNKRKIDGAPRSHSKRKKHISKIWEPVGYKTYGQFEFLVDKENFVIVYTDGSCINNGQDGACAGYGVYFDDNHPLNAAKPVSGRVTNNVGEIQAAIHAIKTAKEMNIEKLCISTDSQFLINAVTAWICAWKRNDWQLKGGGSVKNIADFKELDKLLQDDSIIVKWNYVRAHKGIKGNEMADKLAKEGADLYKRAH